MVTQAWTDSPCRSSPIVRIAVETIVWSSAARNMPSISPDRIVRICRWRQLARPTSASVGGRPGRGVGGHQLVPSCRGRRGRGRGRSRSSRTWRASKSSVNRCEQLGEACAGRARSSRRACAAKCSMADARRARRRTCAALAVSTSRLARPSIGVGLALEQPVLDQRRDLAADGGRIGLDGLGQRAGAHRPVDRERASAGVGRPVDVVRAPRRAARAPGPVERTGRRRR